MKIEGWDAFDVSDAWWKKLDPCFLDKNMFKIDYQKYDYEQVSVGNLGIF